MPVPQAVQTRVETFLSNIAATIATRQATYLADNGKYWQGLKCCSVTPSDGNTRAPDRLTSKPTDQVATWGTLNINPGTSLEVNLWCDAYQSPGNRHGYMMGVEVFYGGELWRRTRNFQGPETSRTTPWTRITSRAIG